MGLNRNLHLDATSDADKIELEYSRRTFWCAYTLDIYLSVALGRARAFHDEDIDATIPQCIEDSELTRPAGELTSPKTDVSVMYASVAHIKYVETCERMQLTITSDLHVS